MSDDKFKQGIDNLYRWYYTEIRDCVQAAINELDRSTGLSEDNIEPQEWLQEYVDRLTDNHEFVIYTYKARTALLVSSNEGAYEDETGEKPPTPEVACCFAMRADIWQVLNARSKEWEPK